MNEITIRYDEQLRAYVLNLNINGLPADFTGNRQFEALGSSLSEAFTDMAEQLDEEGI